MNVMGDAIEMRNESFNRKEGNLKSMDIIPDGEDNKEVGIEKAKEAADAGVIIHTIGIGSPNGAEILDPKTNTPKLDEQGNPVISKLNEAALKDIASAGNGTYTLLRNTDDAASKIIDEIDSICLLYTSRCV